MNITELDIKDALKKAGVDADVDAIKSDDSFKSHGLDSLDLFNLFVELESITGFQIPDEDIEFLTSINDIVSYHEKI